MRHKRPLYISYLDIFDYDIDLYNKRRGRIVLIRFLNNIQLDDQTYTKFNIGEVMQRFRFGDQDSLPHDTSETYGSLLIGLEEIKKKPIQIHWIRVGLDS